MAKKGIVDRIQAFLDTRIGFTETILRPVPSHAMNPFSWLGAIAVLAFFAQGLTGILMLFYYIPTTSEAYSSTIHVIRSVPMGSVIETFHLYMAYAMIIIVFLHLMRNYFTSVQKRPREAMWVVGFVMGTIVLFQAFTGYLLPWTVLAKSATDVGIGFLGVLPPQLYIFVKYLIAGVGTNSQELYRFFVFHVVVLPFTLLLLIVLKLYMFEIHGATDPASGAKPGDAKPVKWFPDVLLYMLMISGVFVAAVVVASALFPLQLPPEYSANAPAVVVQPDWYFLWQYQLLKFQVFAGPGEPLALAVITMGALLMFFLPFFDRKKERNPMNRPVYTTLGVIIIAELVVLTIWGYMTPGQTIPNMEAVGVVGGVALVVAALLWLTFKLRQKMTGPVTVEAVKGRMRFLRTPFTHRGPTLVFLAILAVASVSMATVVGQATTPQPDIASLLLGLAVLFGSLYALLRLMRRLVMDYQAMVTSS
ncbi:MAG: cytochrome bc complex cytochrome b subunit [Nitrososphaerota archaeon]|nr:cytochrome bc complex cytochrome b subunit [Nitrososphaerota archaeon]MDG6939895.1 cytochrome bc complex cytochrome b subunit [Nitrososphaerota archaeon]